MNITPLDLAEGDAPYWAFLNRLKIDGRPFSLEGRKYQLEIMRPVTDDGKVKTNEVIRKGSQIGITMGKVIEITHGAKYGMYPQGIIYYFPSTKSVEHFSKTRFKPFLDDNPEEVKKYVSDTNAVAIRRIGSTNVNFFGCSATVRVGGEAKDSTSVRSTPADWVLLDERDIFDNEMARQVNQRLGNSTINRRTDLGTPKLPDDGVDLLYKRSDMRRWQIKCTECGKHTCLETEFPDCIKIDDNGKGYPACIHCGSLILRSNGTWIPDFPDRDVVGYWASQLLNPNRDLVRVLKEYDNPVAYDLTKAEFQRTVLGQAFVDVEDALFQTDVFACCTGDSMSYSHEGPCAMGVDVGNPIYAVIGYRMDRDRYKVIKVARLPDWNALHDLAKRFNVKSCVIDAAPEYHRVREFQKAEPYGVYLCNYSEHQKTFDAWDTDNMVNVNRTEVFDATHDLVKSAGKLSIPRVCEEINLFAEQMVKSAKVQETDLRTNTMIYRYRCRGDKEDHYRNAMNYFYLACKKVGIPTGVSSQKRLTVQDTVYSL